MQRVGIVKNPRGFSRFGIHRPVLQLQLWVLHWIEIFVNIIHETVDRLFHSYFDRDIQKTKCCLFVLWYLKHPIKFNSTPQKRLKPISNINRASLFAFLLLGICKPGLSYTCSLFVLLLQFVYSKERAHDRIKSHRLHRSPCCADGPLAAQPDA